MKDNSGIIRPLAICIFKNGDKILACLGKDEIKKNEFYRPLGGGIEFGESGEETIKREIHEELSEEITNIRYLGTFENIFSYNGKPHHEIVLVYNADFVNKKIYETNEIDVKEMDWFVAHWLSIEDCKSGKYLLYPEGLINIL